MPEKKKRTYEVDARGPLSLTLQPRPGTEENTRPSLLRPVNKSAPPFSRELILRLIDWLKQE
jgi:hypothetical protein